MVSGLCEVLGVREPEAGNHRNEIARMGDLYAHPDGKSRDLRWIVAQSTVGTPATPCLHKFPTSLLPECVRHCLSEE